MVRVRQRTIVRLRELLGNQSYSYGVPSPEIDHLAPAEDMRQAHCGNRIVLRSSNGIRLLERRGGVGRFVGGCEEGKGGAGTRRSDA